MRKFGKKKVSPYFLTVTPNPTVDRAITVEGLKVGTVQPVKEAHCYAGGKGINVARVLKLLGADVGAAMLRGGMYGEHLEKSLREEGIPSFSIEINGNTRSNITIIDSTSDEETHLLEPGPRVSADEVVKFLSLFEEIIRKTKFVILSGSLPPGMPEDIYGQLISRAQDYGIRCALDTRGAALKLGVRAKLFLLKPNRTELEEIVGEKLSSIDEIVDGARDIVKNGIDVVLVSLGKDGMIFVNKGSVWKATPPEIKVTNSVGSGDALLAGFVFSYLRDGKIEDAISLGMACGVANCLGTVAGAFKIEDVERFRSEITVSKL